MNGLPDAATPSANPTDALEGLRNCGEWSARYGTNQILSLAAIRSIPDIDVRYSTLIFKSSSTDSPTPFGAMEPLWRCGWLCCHRQIWNFHVSCGCRSTYHTTISLAENPNSRLDNHTTADTRVHSLRTKSLSKDLPRQMQAFRETL